MTVAVENGKGFWKDGEEGKEEREEKNKTRTSGAMLSRLLP